ncbi:hypothetical protein BDR05DRAFT_994958 [Suillus weaverae]|nr:hypothetical protein BDR05DRAFT_994958 [Suillus weaverae]
MAMRELQLIVSCSGVLGNVELFSLENSSNGTTSSLALIHSIVQIFISVVATTLLFATMPSGRLIGDRVAGKSRKYLASSIVLWALVFSIEHVQKLLYHQVDSGHDCKCNLRAPPFFISQSDKGFKGKFFPPGSEAE